MRRTTCYACRQKLTGKKTRFCGVSCYAKHKQKLDRDRRLARKTFLPEKKCLYCDTVFVPSRIDVVACSKPCSYEHAKGIQNKRRREAPKKLMPRVRPLDSGLSLPPKPINPRLIKLITTADFNPSSQTRDAVLTFLGGGGKISKLPDEPGVRTPSVGILHGYSPSDFYGHALEYELSLEANAGNA